MANCLATKGRKEACKEFIGGLYKVWFANYDTITPVLDSDNVITNFTGTTTLFEYELKGVSKLAQEMVSNRDNGITSVTQTLTLDLKGGDYVTNNEIKLLAYGRPHIFVQDNYGATWMVGRVRGADLTSGLHDSGAAVTDKYGYTLTFVAQEREYANFVSGSTIANAFVGMANAPTIVKGT